MKAIFKLVLGSAIFAGGGAVGYFIAKKRYVALADAEVESVKKELVEYYEKHGVLADPVKKEEKKAEPVTKTVQSSSIDDFKAKTEDTYVNYAKQYQTEEVEQKVKATKEAAEQPKKKQCPPPYIINNDTFAASEYSTKTVYYYITDEVLADDSGRKIDEALSLVGKDFKKYATSEDFVYVRNEEIEMDFEIIFEPKAYASIKSTERVVKEEYE